MTEYRTVYVRSSLRPQWWRHPIQWWQLRGLRRLDRKEARRRKALSPEMRAMEDQHRRDVERAFFFGEGI